MNQVLIVREKVANTGYVVDRNCCRVTVVHRRRSRMSVVIISAGNTSLVKEIALYHLRVREQACLRRLQSGDPSADWAELAQKACPAVLLLCMTGQSQVSDLCPIL